MINIQSNKERTLPHHFDCSCALYGAIDSAMDYRLTSFEEVESGKFDALIKQNLFVGSVEFMREVFKRIGKHDVRLPANSNREYETITLSEAHDRVAKGKTLFIKPLQIKLFTGLVLDGCVYSCLKGLPDDTQVMAYEPFKERLISEWRIYIHNHKMVDSRNYSVDFTINPDYGYVKHIINDNKKDFPCAYTVDIGVLEYSKDSHSSHINTNVVIEYNDMVSIGQYGMPNDLYLRLLKDRYFEIVK